MKSILTQLHILKVLGHNSFVAVPWITDRPCRDTAGTVRLQHLPWPKAPHTWYHPLSSATIIAPQICWVSPTETQFPWTGRNRKTDRLSSSSFLPRHVSFSVQTFWKPDNICQPNPSKPCPGWWPQRPLPHYRDAWNPVIFSSEANFPNNMLVCIPVICL